MTTKKNAKTFIAIILLFISFLTFSQTIPPIPTGLRVAATECGKIRLAWDDYPATVEKTDFDILRSDSENGYYYSFGSSTGLEFSDESYNMQAGMNYYYKIRGKNGNVASESSSSVTGVFTCEAPTNLKVDATVCGAVTLSWDLIPTASNDFGYLIYGSVSGLDGSYNFIGSVAKNINTYIDKSSDLSSGIKYYKVNAQFIRYTYSEYSNIAICAPITCPVPIDLTVSGSSCGRIALEWKDYPPEISETGFAVFRAESENGNYNYVGTVGPNVLRTSDIGYLLTPNKTYYYKISGVFNNSFTGLGNVATGSFSCNSPTGLQIASTNCGEINLSWNDYPAGQSESGYVIYRATSETGYYSEVTSVGPNILTYKDNSYNLQPNQVYYYKIAGKFFNSRTDPTLPIVASFICQVPTGLKVESSTCGSISLSWADYPAGTNETGYTLYRSSSETGYYYQVADLNANVLTFTDQTSGLQPAQTFYYKLRGRFGNTYTDFGNLATGSFNCPVPTGLSISAVSCGSISLTWSDFPAGISESGYLISYSTSENGTYQSIGNVTANVTTFTTSYYYQPEQRYYFKIQGVFNNSYTNFSASANAKFSCDIPSGIQVTSTSCGEINISWADYPTGINETGYRIYRSTSENSNYDNIGSVNANVLNYSDKGSLLSGQNYFYKIQGNFNNTYTYLSAPTFGSFNCNTPSGLQVVSATCGSIKISWDDLPSGSSESGFAVYRSENQDGYFYQIGVTGSNVLNYTDIGNNGYLNNNTTYYYKIKGLFNNSQTDFSNRVSTSFNCDVPTNLQVTASSCGSISLSWDDYPTGNIETGYIIYRADSENGYLQQVGQVNANLLTFTDVSSGMAPGNTYYYKVAGRFNNTITAISAVASGSFTCTVPTGLQVTTSSCGSISLSWADFPPPIIESGYEIYRSDTENGSYSYVASLYANTLSYIDKNSSFNAGPNYYYKIRGRINNTYTGLNGAVMGTFTCLEPTGLRISSTNCGKINLAWDDYPVSNTEQGYAVYRSTTENGVYTQIGTTSNNILTLTDTYYLIPDQIYYYKIKGIFNNTLTGFSNLVNGSYSCAAPTGLAISSTSCGKINLAWTAYSANIIESGYIIYRAETQNGSFVQVGNVSADVISFTDNSYLQPNKTYYYKIAGYFINSNSSFSEVVSGSFSCEVPQGLRISTTNCGQISLAWNDYPNTTTETGYQIYRSETGEYGNYINVGSVGPNVLQYTDNNYYLVNDKNYYYKIAGLFNNTISAFSASANGSFICPIPTGLTVTASTCNSISLSWADYPNTTLENGYELYRSESENGYYYYISRLTANTLSYIDNSNQLVLGRNYYYKLKGYINNFLTDYSAVAIGSLNCNLHLCASVKTGLWTDPTVWSCGHVPASADEIVISTGHTITISENLTANAKNLENNGTLLFGVGARLILNVP
jgi:hypothetical protein